MFGFLAGLTLLAQVLGSQDYRLEMLDPRTTKISPRETVGKNLEEVKFSLRLSETIIDFGVIRPTNPVLRDTVLLASPSGMLGYSLVGFENHPLRLVSSGPASPVGGQEIPDTTCDSGACRETLASEWTNPFAFGFGFTPLSGAGEKTYRQFTNEEAGETKQNLKSDRQTRELKITYKVNVSKTQVSGIYTNIITYILVPNF